MTKEKRLGRGLSALFENELEENILNEDVISGESIQEISIDKLISGKFQPRKSFEPSLNQVLTNKANKCHSQKQHGQL